MKQLSSTGVFAGALSILVAIGACGGDDNDNGGDPPDAAQEIDAAAGVDAVPGTDAPRGELENWCTFQGPDFSFFVTSMDALWILSNSAPGDLSGGFGGNFGGLEGADDICQRIGAATGHGDKTWRAFLSATDDGNGNPVHAIDRIGEGPWYDANGRLVATSTIGLTIQERPDGDPQTINDLPDECGVPLSVLGDSHDVVTASDENGRLYDPDPESTCNDWTSSDGNVGGDGTIMGGRVMCGHSFPRMGGPGPGGGMRGQNAISDHQLRGCGKGANLIQNGPGEGSCIGCTGGYGALYCFAE